MKKGITFLSGMGIVLTILLLIGLISFIGELTIQENIRYILKFLTIAVFVLIIVLLIRA